jgi:membrane protein involved in colicin uptake
MADEPTPPDTPAPDPPDPEPDPELDSLDERSRRLVERANAEAATRRRETRAAEQRAQALERELAEHRQAQESETERLVREAEQRGFEKAAPMVLEAELAIAAAGRMRYPQDAARLLPDSTRAELLAITERDARAKAATKAVDELLSARPEMGLDANGGATPPLVTQGARSGSAPKSTPQDPDEWLRQAGKR